MGLLEKVYLAVFLIWGSKVFRLEAVSQDGDLKGTSGIAELEAKHSLPRPGRLGPALEEKRPQASALRVNAGLLFLFLLFFKSETCSTCDAGSLRKT